DLELLEPRRKDMLIRKPGGTDLLLAQSFGLDRLAIDGGIDRAGIDECGDRSVDRVGWPAIRHSLETFAQLRPEHARFVGDGLTDLLDDRVLALIALVANRT